MAKRVPALTAAQVAAAKPGVELIDGQVPGLRLRVGPNGVRMWSLSCRDAKGERRRFDVGGGIGLAEARRKAQDLRRQVREGADPVAERRAARERARAAKEGIGTLGSVIEAYFATGPGAALRTRGDQEKHLRRVFVKQLTSSAGDMTAAALQLVIDRYPTKVSAARAVAYLTPVTKWAAKRGLMGGRIELEKPAVGDDDAEDNGQRVLTPDELKAILPCLDDAHGRCARFLLLTGVRLREATGGHVGGVRPGCGHVDHPAGPQEGHEKPDTAQAGAHSAPRHPAAPASCGAVERGAGSRGRTARTGGGAEDPA